VFGFVVCKEVAIFVREQAYPNVVALGDDLPITTITPIVPEFIIDEDGLGAKRPGHHYHMGAPIWGQKDHLQLGDLLYVEDHRSVVQPLLFTSIICFFVVSLTLSLAHRLPCICIIV